MPSEQALLHMRNVAQSNDKFLPIHSDEAGAAHPLTNTRLLKVADSLCPLVLQCATKEHSPMDAAKNFAKGTLSQGYDDEATSIVLVAGDGARFPTAPFNATWWNSTDYPDPSDDSSREIVRVTAKSTDTLTVTRGQEGTSPLEHDDEGKVYKLIAGLTAKAINDQMLPGVSHVGDDWLVESPGALELQTTDTFTVVCDGSGLRLAANAVGVVLEMTGGKAMLGDVDENNTGVTVSADDNLGQVSLKGKIGTDQIASASGPVGTVIGKVPYYNLAGTLVGYIPIYNSIT